MKSFAIPTTSSFLRRLSVAAAALLVSIGAARAATNYSATILADNPVAYYQLQELPGATTAIDSSSNALDGSYNFNSVDSPTLGEPGIDTNSILFTYGAGPSDFGDIVLPGSVLLAPVQSDGVSGAPFSAECWTEATTFTNLDYIVPLAMSGAYGSPNANGSGWNFYQSETTPWTWQVFMRTPTAVDILGNGAVVTLGTWTYLAVTWDGTNASFYVNGQLNDHAALPGYLADPNGSDGVIGGPGETGHGAFEGGVTQVAFYTNVLTAAQILNHYNVGTNNIAAPLAPPSFVSEPAVPSQIFSGAPITLTALTAGTAPISYQWFSNNVTVAGQTNNTYTFIPVYPANDGASYFVAVINAIGSTNSTTNVLTVLTNLNVGAAPYSITRNVGSHAAFRVSAGGAVPIGYQWSVSSNGTAFTTISNQIGDTLWLTNVDLTMSGNQYAVVVTNPFLSYSNAATLTVQPRAVTVPLAGYGALVSNDNPVAFFRLNEASNSTTAVDAVGSFDGAYNNALGPINWGFPTEVPGDTNVGVELLDTNSAVGNGGVVDIPYALELDPHGTWTFEGWFEPVLQDGLYRTVCSSMYNSNFSAAVFGWLIYQHPASAFTLVTFNGTGGPATFASDVTTNFYPLNIKSWYHLALVDDGTTIRLYINGVGSQDAVGPASQFIPDGVNGDPNLGAAPSVLGQRSDLAFNGFNGGVADVAFYNYALSASQIMAHYAGSGKATLGFAEANGATTLTWTTGNLLGSTNVSGPYNPIVGATSPYTVAYTNSQFFYVLGLNP
jgi:hypothetical protein